MTQEPCNPDMLQDNQINIPFLKSYLTQFFDWQKEQFIAGVDVMLLVPSRSAFMDKLLTRLWRYYKLNTIPDISLLAVGGYGRGELHPLSDIDILILTQNSPTPEQKETFSELLRLMWDIRLDVGHAVRTVKECFQTGKKDISIATNLQESRLITGDNNLFLALQEKIFSDKFWSSTKFYKAKLSEMHDRHNHYHDTSYNLEPDIKASLGGLRDIHMLFWVARRHFGATSLFEMSQFGFLTESEYRELSESLAFLWKVRFALHLGLKRYDNRLSFAQQPIVADLLGYEGEQNKRVEKLMRDFFSTLQSVAELSKMLLQYFDQTILPSKFLLTESLLNKDFFSRGKFIEARKPALFQARPDTILDMFLLIARTKSISAIGAQTLRQLRTARRRINISLSSRPQAREKFMTLIRHPNFIAKTVGMMHRHGVFTLYIPQWSNIVSRMQFDLFHAYTVDEHSIRALKKLHLFTQPKLTPSPLSSEVYEQVQRKDLLILATIFHDIGKGHGGNHSEIGAEMSKAFCLQHGLSQPEANTVSFLVRNHLLLSMTAQKRDIYDPEVVRDFATIVRDEEHLMLLLCLTVADICATNPELWNSWKQTLIGELYHATQKALRRGLENPPDIRAKVRANKAAAIQLLAKKKYPLDKINHLFNRFKANYFLRNTPEQIAWHGKAILRHVGDDPLVLISKKTVRGGTEIFIYMKDKPKLFATVAAQLDIKNISIHDSMILESKDDYTLDSFVVLEQNGAALDMERRIILKETLTDILKEDQPKLRVRKSPHRLKHFKVQPQIDFMLSKNKRKTQMELIALDTPGLLARTGLIFSELELNLHAAKITTIGEKVEDFFILSDKNDQPLNTVLQNIVAQRIIEELKPKE